MEILNNASVLLGVLMVMAFVVNIIVQITKDIIPLPTKLWVVLVAMTVTLAGLFAGASFECLRLSVGMVVICMAGSFIVAYVAMYGFDTLKELWTRFKGGENINDGD